MWEKRGWWWSEGWTVLEDVWDQFRREGKIKSRWLNLARTRAEKAKGLKRFKNPHILEGYARAT